MSQLVQWCLVAAVAIWLCQVAESCNVRELSQIIQNRFRQEVATTCGGLGDKCSFDRDCCRGLECKMSAFKGGIDNYCQKMVIKDTGEENIPLIESGDTQPANEPSSPEDGAWMLADSDDKDSSKGVGDNEDDQGNQLDTLGKIDRLQNKKRLQLIRENEELERLFTEKDEKELEQLRAIKEDAEMDELRRLKELRLKRKLELLKELEELRHLKAQENLAKFDQYNNRTEVAEDVSNAVEGAKDDLIVNNDTNPLEVTEQETQPDEEASEDPLNTTFIEESSQEPGQAIEPELTTVKHKKAHGGHHRRKHHKGKHNRKHSHSSTGNFTDNADGAPAAEQAE